MKYFLIIGDGMADNPLDSLGGITPLEHAEKKNIDLLASGGVIGSVKTVPSGFTPGSDTAIMSILGCSPAEYYRGRAALEAASQGIQLEPGDAAFRCNNVALSNGSDFGERIMLSHSAGGISGDESIELMSYLFSHPDFAPLARRYEIEIHPTSSYRHTAVRKNADIRGLKLYPPHDHLGKKLRDIKPEGSTSSADLLEMMQAAIPILSVHPINFAREKEGKLPGNAIWFWAQGEATVLPNFEEQFKKSGAMISAVPLCNGIARLIGLDVYHVPGATGELETNYAGKVDAALEAVKTHDFVTIHYEAPDECTHLGDLEGKLLAINYLDTKIVAPLVAGLREYGDDFRILILSDHKTLMADGNHNGDPVPFLIYDSRAEAGSGLSYTEKNCEQGVYVDDGTKILRLLFEQDEDN